MDQAVENSGPVKCPRGFFAAKVDGAGRLKLPAKYQDYHAKLADKSLYVTVIRGQVRIYLCDAWERNLAKLASDKKLRQRIAFLADAVGGEVEIDPQGRITLPQNTRRVVPLEDQAVQLRMFEDIVTILQMPEYEEQKIRIDGGIEADLDRAEDMGFDL